MGAGAGFGVVLDAEEWEGGVFQSFDGRDLGPVRLDCEHGAGLHRLPVDEDGARAAAAGVAAKVFDTLSKNGINIEMISTSEIRISVVVKKKWGQKAVQVLHGAFELGKLENKFKFTIPL